MLFTVLLLPYRQDLDQQLGFFSVCFKVQVLKNQNAGLPLLLQKLLAPGEYVEKTEPKNFSEEDEELGIHRVFTVLSFLDLIWEDFLDVFSPRMLKNNFKASFVHYCHFLMSKGHVQVSPREGEIT